MAIIKAHQLLASRWHITKANPLKAKEHKMRMVVDALQIEPVSNSNSLLTGKLTGNFVESGPLARFLRQIGKPIQWLAAKFLRKA